VTKDVPTAVAPWISVPDGTRAVAFFEAAFGAQMRHGFEDDEGRVQVARLAVGEAEFWISEDRDAQVPANGGTIRMILTVPDPDGWFERAIAAGATEVAAVYEGHGWRVGRLADPFGHHWELGRPLD
jgi:PhnB protein